MSLAELNIHETEDHDISVVDRLSPQEFRDQYIKSKTPVKFTGMMDDWPATKNWSLEFFRELEANSTVHLEEGNVMQSETQFRKKEFRDFVNSLISGEESGYLSVFRIFDQFPELRNDVDFSILDQFKIKSSTSGWLGPKGTVTGYHIDWGDNILAQIVGRKCLHLVSPDDTPNMYVSRKFDQGTTISNVDIDQYDENEYPKFANVRQHRIILNPGEMIFIPRGWWHHVRSLDVSISVSNIAYDLAGILFDVIPHRCKQVLHDRGIWKCDCTCHLNVDGKWVRK